MVKTLIYNCCCLVINYFVGNQKVIFEKQLCLEDLLEQQHLQDPVCIYLIMWEIMIELIECEKFYILLHPVHPVIVP
jgi:hypothetical protein